MGAFGFTARTCGGLGYPGSSLSSVGECWVEGLVVLIGSRVKLRGSKVGAFARNETRVLVECKSWVWQLEIGDGSLSSFLHNGAIFHVHI